MFPDFQTRLMLVKALCISVEGVCIALVAGLAQWAADDVAPSRIAWIVIIASAIANGFGKLGNFLSTSFGDYMIGKKNGKLVSEDKTTTTKVVDSAAGPVKVTSETTETTKIEPTKETP